jgi:Winged helix DNA-binding domain
MVLRVSREQVLGYRVAAHGLRRDGSDGVLALGVQDTPPGSARLALTARGLTWPANGHVLAWTLRGAPHLHRAADLRPFALALWPRSEADGLAKIAWERSRLRATGMSIHEALTTAAHAMRATVEHPTTKGAASAAVTARIPAALSRWCQPCRSTHIFESLFRMAALPAGLRLEPDVMPATLVPLADWPGPPTEQTGVSWLITTYLRLLGPATIAEVASWLCTTRSELRSAWPDDLVEVDVDGRTAWLPQPDVDALRSACRPGLVRLLAPSDPYLQARDRTWLVPDSAARKTIWAALGSPGALLVNGELAGVWRPKATGKRLQLTVTPFGGLHPEDRATIEAEAQRIATVRDIPQVTVHYAL